MEDINNLLKLYFSALLNVGVFLPMPPFSSMSFHCHYWK